MATPMTISEARRQLRLPAVDAVTAAQVKSAFRAAAKLHHPDSGDQPDPGEFRRAVEAARVLAGGDPARPSDTADVADALRGSFDEMLRAMRRVNLHDRPASAYIDRARDELIISNVPPGASVVIEGQSTGFRVVDENGAPISIRFGQ